MGLARADKKQFIYVAKSTKGSLLYGHVFQVKEKAAEVARAIHHAFVAFGGADASSLQFCCLNYDSISNKLEKQF